MAENKTLYSIKLDSKQFESTIKRLGKKMDGFNRKLSKSGVSGGGKSGGGKSGGVMAFGGLGFARTAFAAVGAAAFLAGKKVLTLGAAMQQTRVAFGVLLGSKGVANQMVDNLNEMANVTPFVNSQLFEAAKKLLNYGLSGKKIMPTLKMLGDVSMGNAEKLQRISLAYGQIKSTGRLMGQDLLQLINAGFNPLQEIAKKTGRSMRELKDDMRKGLIPFAMVEQAFKDATSEGGRFFNMMEKQSETFSGKMSTLTGKIEVMAATWGESIAESLTPVLSSIIDQLDLITDKQGALAGFSKRSVSAFDNQRRTLFEARAELLQLEDTEENKDKRKGIEQKLGDVFPRAIEFNKKGFVTGFSLDKAKELLFQERDFLAAELKSNIAKMDEDFNTKRSNNKRQQAARLTVQLEGMSEKTKRDNPESLVSLNKKLGTLNREVAEQKKKRAEAQLLLQRVLVNPFSNAAGITGVQGETDTTGGTSKLSGKVAGISSGGVKNITLNIDKLGEVTLNSTTTQDMNKLKDSVQQILIEAASDAARVVGG